VSPSIRAILHPTDLSPLSYPAFAHALRIALAAKATWLCLRLMGATGWTAGVIIRYGNVVQTILDAAVEYDVDFICMPTAGHHGILDALRGSTTERVLRHAPCPLLAIAAV
jgi:nucleotide-binding universal stress UspA family protein